MTQAATKRADIRTINGLLDILSDNIESINADSSDANIKRTNAILQNVNAVKGIYNLALDNARLNVITKQNTPSVNDFLTSSRNYHTNKELLGNVLGDSEAREKNDHEQAVRNLYDRAYTSLYNEVEQLREGGDQDDELEGVVYYRDHEIEIFNDLLSKSKKVFKTRIEQDEYLLEALKPEHFEKYASRELE